MIQAYVEVPVAVPRRDPESSQVPGMSLWNEGIKHQKLRTIGTANAIKRHDSKLVEECDPMGVPDRPTIVRGRKVKHLGKRHEKDAAAVAAFLPSLRFPSQIYQSSALAGVPPREKYPP